MLSINSKYSFQSFRRGLCLKDLEPYCEKDMIFFKFDEFRSLMPKLMWKDFLEGNNLSCVGPSYFTQILRLKIMAKIFFF